MVWSDPEIKKLSKEFVTVADEAYYLYPENPQHLERAGSREDHRFFRKFGEQMPPGDWNRGTKQGIYMMGPNSEYLEGRFAASSEPEDIKARLRRALARWETLRKEKGYGNKPIPTKSWAPPPDVVGDLILRVNARDLPRGGSDKSGARRHEMTQSGMWLDFVKWAWNENWFALEKANALVPKGTGPEPVNPAIVRRMASEVLIDNVRGQISEWRPDEVKTAAITMKRLPSGRIEYTGSVAMSSGARGFDGKVYGQGSWDGSKFTELDVVVIGIRRGAGSFNQRERDPGPAPLGITLSLRRK